MTGHESIKSCFFCENNCLIKKNCYSGWLQLVNTHKYQVLYEKGKDIIKEGTPVLGTFAIQSGIVKVEAPGIASIDAGMSSLHPHIIRLAKAGDILNYTESRDNIYQVNATALEDSVTCFIDNELFNKLLSNNPPFVIALMNYYSAELRKLELQIKVLTQTKSAKQRIAETLLTLVEDFGLNEKNELNISLYRREIAQFSRVSTEGVIRTLSEFERDKIIKKGKRIIIENIELLKNLTRQLGYP